jgi:RNA polymerase sigma factor (TIGR02999 family)
MSAKFICGRARGYNPFVPEADHGISDATRLLRDWANGDAAALKQLTPHVYKELRRIAGRFMGNELADRSMQATALVHEAYLKLIDIDNVDWQHRAHFFAVSATIMRHILVDRARHRGAVKRGGAFPKVDLDAHPEVGAEGARELIALDDALNDLAKLDPRKAKVVELRYFAGLSVQETAEVLAVSVDTVMRDWRSARAWLRRELSG